jgi:hypothetical protein
MIQRLTKWLEARRKARDFQAAHVDVNAKCPWCGNFGCKLTAVQMKRVNAPTAPAEALVRRECNTCGGEVFEKTVAPAETFLRK